MFSPDSPLKRLPPNSNRKLLICLDSFCHSAQICELAYGRLYRQLTKLALTKETQLHPWVIPEAFMHAWAIVDELHRLDGLLKATPGLVVTLPPGEPSFTEQIESITLMRNVVDHLNRTVDLVVASKLPALGKLNWITVADSGSDRYVCGVLVPGTVTYDSKGGYKPVRPRTEIGPSDHITLSVGKHSASLTDAMGALSKVVRLTEDGLNRAFAEPGGDAPMGKDILIRAYIDGDGKSEEADIVCVPAVIRHAT